MIRTGRFSSGGNGTQTSAVKPYGTRVHKHTIIRENDRIRMLMEYLSNSPNRAGDIVTTIVQRISLRGDCAQSLHPEYYEGEEVYSPSPPILSGRIVDID